MLQAKKIDLTMILDGKDFHITVDIPSASAKEQYYRSQGIGDIVAKTIFHNSDIRDSWTKEPWVIE